MPGRSCVALTLLIVLCDREAAAFSLEKFLSSEIPAGGPLDVIRLRAE